MKSKKSSPITYKRKKDEVEITGDPKDTKSLVWVDMISSKFWMVLVIVLLYTVPEASFLPLLWEWLKKRVLFLIPFAVVASWLQMLLSG